MAILHNRISHKELREKMLQETGKRITISFYKYIYFANPQSVRDELFATLFPMSVFGRIYIAHEGINAQLSVPEIELENFKKYIQ